MGRKAGLSQTKIRDQVICLEMAKVDYFKDYSFGEYDQQLKSNVIESLELILAYTGLPNLRVYSKEGSMAVVIGVGLRGFDTEEVKKVARLIEKVYSPLVNIEVLTTPKNLTLYRDESIKDAYGKVFLLLDGYGVDKLSLTTALLEGSRLNQKMKRVYTKELLTLFARCMRSIKYMFYEYSSVLYHYQDNTIPRDDELGRWIADSFISEPYPNAFGLMNIPVPESDLAFLSGYLKAKSELTTFLIKEGFDKKDIDRVIGALYTDDTTFDYSSIKRITFQQKKG